jgi:hypothetical protein
MLWVQSVRDVIAANTHAEILYDVYPQVVRYLEFIERSRSPVTGLIDLPDEHWSQTAYIDTRGYRDRRGQSTAINALYAQTLLEAADLAAALQQWGDAVTWRGRSIAVRDSINVYLYQPELHRYAATIENDQVFPATVLAQAWALSYDIVPADEIPMVVQAMLELLGSDPENAPIGTYGFYWVLRALGKTGYVDQALDLIRTYYGSMLSKGATTWWEWFEANLHYDNSLSHGWAGSPTWFLSTYALGLRTEGMQTWSLHLPLSSQLHEVAGSLPIQNGEVYVHWTQTTCGEFEVTITSPPDSQGSLVLPSASPDVIVSLDRRELTLPQMIRSSGSEEVPRVAHYGLEGGSHLLQIRMPCSLPPVGNPVP